MAIREEMPADNPDIFSECDAGNCSEPAETWIYDPALGVYLPACRQCAIRESEWTQ